MVEHTNDDPSLMSCLVNGEAGGLFLKIHFLRVR